MMDLGHLAPRFTSDVQMFQSQGGAWMSWNKPRGASMCYMLCIGGGGGGGGCNSNTNSSDFTGMGGGGGSSGLATLVIPALLLPDTLYVQVGAGGAGGAGGSGSGATAGSAGGVSYVSLSKNTSAPNVVLYSGGAAGGGGVALPSTSSTTSSGAAGSAASAATNTVLGTLGLFNAVAGQAGAAGFSGTNAWGSIPLNGGPGGAANVAAANTVDWTFASWASGANLNRVDQSGFTNWKPFFSIAAGGTYNAPTGSIPGASGVGSGGAGGGNNGLNTNIKPGGRGGDGLVLIISW